jgi:hypothetical protein
MVRIDGSLPAGNIPQERRPFTSVSWLVAGVDKSVSIPLFACQRYLGGRAKSKRLDDSFPHHPDLGPELLAVNGRVQIRLIGRPATVKFRSVRQRRQQGVRILQGS